MVYPLNISVTKDIVTIFDRKHPLFLSETTSCVYIEKFILASGFKHVKRFLGVFYLRCKILIKSDISMNDCYLNFLVSFRALFSLDVGANLVNSKQTIGIILPDLSLLGYAVPVESFGIGLFVILFAYLIIEYNVQLLGYLTIKSRRPPKANIGTPEKVSEGVWRLWIDSPEERIVTYHL